MITTHIKQNRFLISQKNIIKTDVLLWTMITIALENISLGKSITDSFKFSQKTKW